MGPWGPEGPCGGEDGVRDMRGCRPRGDGADCCPLGPYLVAFGAGGSLLPGVTLEQKGW